MWLEKHLAPETRFAFFVFVVLTVSLHHAGTRIFLLEWEGWLSATKWHEREGGNSCWFLLSDSSISSCLGLKKKR